MQVFNRVETTVFLDPWRVRTTRSGIELQWHSQPPIELTAGLTGYDLSILIGALTALRDSIQAQEKTPNAKPIFDRPIA